MLGDTFQYKFSKETFLDDDNDELVYDAFLSTDDWETEHRLYSTSSAWLKFFNSDRMFEGTA